MTNPVKKPDGVLCFSSEADWYAQQLKEFGHAHGDNAFLRFAWSRSRCEWFDVQASYDQACADAMDERGRDVKLRATALRKAIERFQTTRDPVLHRQRLFGLNILTGADLEAVRHIEKKVAPFPMVTNLPDDDEIRPGSKPYRWRLYFVAAMLPYLEVKRLTRRPCPLDRITIWEHQLRRIPLMKPKWADGILRAGGLSADDLRRYQAHPLSPSYDVGGIRSWWRRIRTDQFWIPFIIRAGAAYIAWTRQLYRQGVPPRRSWAPLRGRERDYANSAAKTLARECEVSTRRVLREWESSVYL